MNDMKGAPEVWIVDDDRSIRWVLLDGIGNATTRNDVPPALVQQTLEALAVD